MTIIITFECDTPRGCIIITFHWKQRGGGDSVNHFPLETKGWG